MVARKATDEQLLALYEKVSSPTEVGRIFGMSARQVSQRLRQAGVPAPKLGEQVGRDALQTVKIAHGRVSTEIQNGTVIVFSDAHYIPNVASTAHRALLKLINELKPRVVVCNGDAFDGASISRWPRIGWDNKPTVIQELRAVEERLTEVENAAKGAQLIYPLGNHDARFETFLASTAPQYQGVQGFSLKDHFPLWRPCWSFWINDKVVVKHRYHNGIHGARNNTVKAGLTMVTGHLHSLKVTPLTDYTGTRFGVDTGTLADPFGEQFQDYLEDNPRDWRSGFAVMTFHEGRLLWPELCHILDEGVAEFRGTVMQV